MVITGAAYTPLFLGCLVSVKSAVADLHDLRRILLFPFGNSNAPPNDTVSVYLDYADPKRAPEGWHACAQFALVISNPSDPTIYTVSRTLSSLLFRHPRALRPLRVSSHSLSRIFLPHSPLPRPLVADVFHVADAQHRFIAEESDWGFTRFSELRKLFHTQEGHTRPVIEDESADVSVYVRVLKDPTGVLWHNFVK